MPRRADYIHPRMDCLEDNELVILKLEYNAFISPRHMRKIIRGDCLISYVVHRKSIRGWCPTLDVKNTCDDVTYNTSLHWGSMTDYSRTRVRRHHDNAEPIIISTTPVQSTIINGFVLTSKINCIGADECDSWPTP